MKKIISVLTGMLLVGSMLVGCSSSEVEEIEEPSKEVVVFEGKTDIEYKVYDLQTNPNALEEAVEDEAVEIIGEVGIIQGQGSKGALMQLKIDYPSDWSGYPVDIAGTMEAFDGLEKGDKVKIQGMYRGIEKWSLALEDQDDLGAHRIFFRNIYKYE